MVQRHSLWGNLVISWHDNCWNLLKGFKWLENVNTVIRRVLDIVLKALTKFTNKLGILESVRFVVQAVTDIVQKIQTKYISIAQMARSVFTAAQRAVVIAPRAPTRYTRNKYLVALLCVRKKGLCNSSFLSKFKQAQCLI